MAAKIAAFLITLVVTTILALIGFVLLILALNGYSESDSTYAFSTYGILCFLLVFLLAVTAAVIAHRLLIREFKTVSAAMTASLAAGAIGIVAVFICIVIGVGIAEYLQRYSS